MMSSSNLIRTTRWGGARTCALVALLLTFGAPTIARAELPSAEAPLGERPHPAPAPAPPGAPRVSDTESVASPTPIWYGVQTLIPAAAAGGLAVGGLVLCHSPTCDEVTLAVAATAFALGGGVVHLFHHNSRAALIGLVAKIGLPALGYGVGSLIDSCDPHQSYLCSADGQSSLAVGAFIGVLAGALLAGAIDVGMSQEPALAPPPGRIRVTGPRVAPTVLVTRDRASLALVGRF